MKLTKKRIVMIITSIAIIAFGIIIYKIITTNNKNYREQLLVEDAKRLIDIAKKSKIIKKYKYGRFSLNNIDIEKKFIAGPNGGKYDRKYSHIIIKACTGEAIVCLQEVKNKKYYSVLSEEDALYSKKPSNLVVKKRKCY